MAPEQLFAKKVHELMKRAGKLRDDEVEKVLKMLKETKKEIASTVVNTEWDQFNYLHLKDAIDRAITSYETRFAANQNDALKQSFQNGVDTIDQPLQIANVQVAGAEISTTALDIVQGFSADLIKNVGTEARSKINQAVLGSILGKQSPFKLMQGISKILGESVVPAVGIAYRAERIVRTELARVNSLARQARIESVTRDNPDEWEKMWISSGKAHPRQTHVALNRKKIGLNEKFRGVWDYPHAPGMDASETINCGCTHVVVKKDWDKELLEIKEAEKAVKIEKELTVNERIKGLLNKYKKIKTTSKKKFENKFKSFEKDLIKLIDEIGIENLKLSDLAIRRSSSLGDAITGINVSKKEVDMFKGLLNRLGKFIDINIEKKAITSKVKFLINKRSNRSLYNNGKIELRKNASDESKIHEFGHFFEEDAVKNGVSKSHHWLELRGKRDDKGNLITKKIKELTGNNKYKDYEIAIINNFYKPYVGKIYKDGSEVISMGLQQFESLEKIKLLMQHDINHFAFVFGIMTGAL